LTETANEIAYLGVQVHGGMGFIEETGAAQYMRDARITTIYEGTTGIQANDLIGRKIAREGGATVRALVRQMRGTAVELKQEGGALARIGDLLDQGIDAVEACVAYILEHYAKDVSLTSVGAVPFLKLMGIVCGGWQMGRAALAAQAKIAGGEGDAFYPAKIASAGFYAEHVLAMASSLAQTVVHGGRGALEIPEDQL
jgi:acyl-CoA dehydrogenase